MQGAGDYWWPVAITEAIVMEMAAIVDEFGAEPDHIITCPEDEGYSFDTAYVLIGWGEWPIMSCRLSDRHADAYLIISDDVTEAQRQLYAERMEVRHA